MTMVAKRVTRLIADMAEGECEYRTVVILRRTLLLKLTSGELSTQEDGDIHV